MRCRFGAASLLGVLVVGVATGRVEAQVAWRGWNEGVQAARELDRPILVDVCTQWSGACKRMDRNIYSREDVRDFLNRSFVAIRLDAEAETPARYEGKKFTQRSLAAHFRVSAYPTTLFLRSDGGHLVSVPGYVEPEPFLRLLRFVGEGHLERGVRWEEFRVQTRR